MTITFDEAITQEEADDVRDSLGAEPVVQATLADHLGCQQSLDRNDSNGFFTLQYQCLPTYAVLNWGFRLSPANQATVVGVVNEQGMRRWRNSAPQPQNALHSVPANYLFHGTLNPMWNGDWIDYQDYMTWQHNIGPGGTASLVVAGSVAVD